MILHLFGIGVGLTAIEPDDAGTLRGVGVGVGVWGVIAPLVALFVGGLIAGRVAPTINTVNAAIHGGVVWAVTTIVALVLTMMALGAAVRGVAATGAAVGTVAAGTVAATGQVLPDMDSLDKLGISADDLVGPINQRLEAEGKPRVTAEQLQAAARDAIRTSLRQGKVDRALLIQAIERNTALSRADVEELADRAERALADLRGRASELATQAGHAALQAAETTGKVLLALSIVLILGLGASIGGAIISVRRERREHVVLPQARLG